MKHFEIEVEIAAPVSVVYNQWLQVSEYTDIMEGVVDAGQIDHRRLYWSANFMGKEYYWDLEMYEQDPDALIRWRSTSGPSLEGVVQFTQDGPKTRLHFAMDYDSEGFDVERADAEKFMEARVEQNMREFRDFIERRGRETGGYDVYVTAERK